MKTDQFSIDVFVSSGGHGVLWSKTGSKLDRRVRDEIKEKKKWKGWRREYGKRGKGERGEASLTNPLSLSF